MDDLTDIDWDAELRHWLTPPEAPGPDRFTRIVLVCQLVAATIGIALMAAAVVLIAGGGQ